MFKAKRPRSPGSHVQICICLRVDGKWNRQMGRNLYKMVVNHFHRILSMWSRYKFSLAISSYSAYVVSMNKQCLPAHMCKFIPSVREGRKHSLETSWASKCAGESYDWASCPHCGDPSDDVIHACAHRLLSCSEIVCGVDAEFGKPC
jgi:hypothetical protein